MSKKTDSVAEHRVVDTDTLVPRYENESDNPNHMEPEKYALLVNAISQEGFLQPILVTPMEDGRLRIEDGHHRWWAAKQVGLPQVSVSIKKTGAERAMLLGIGMNRLRGELDLGTTADIIRAVQESLSLEMPEVSMLTGFTAEELETLLSDSNTPEEILEEGAGSMQDIEVEEGKTYLLEISFSDREEFKLAKRKLRKLGGGNLATGVLVALGEDGE